MSKEYVLRIVVREQGELLSERPVLEAGLTDNTALVRSLNALYNLLQTLKTPEQVEKFIRRNELLTRTDLILKVQ